MTTNAVKYGARSEFGGMITVVWSLLTDEGRRMLQFEWIERNGPPVEPRTHRASADICRSAYSRPQIHADVTTDYRPEGLHIQVTVPLT
ncbi:hypothetical protein ACFOYU_11565 [Microvirga sp. GCM10011540]|uniref:hypothetical protein n=1 Tax=Microvirga sp. GCM10011540 TaxID=3317338 RepID=UPI00361FFB45